MRFVTWAATHPERTVNVTVPPGVDDGVRMRVSGEGEAGPQGAPRGDLYVFLEVAPHERFQREGADVYIAEDVTFSHATLGGPLVVETLRGEATIDLPAGTQPGTVVRLRNEGIDRVGRGGRGHQFVTIRVVVPESLEPDQRGLVEKLQGSGL